MSRIVVEMDAAAAAALLMSVDALSEDVANEYHRAAKRGARAIQTGMAAAKRADERQAEQAARDRAAEKARLAAISTDVPFENPKIVQPHAPPQSRPMKLACEVLVFGTRDVSGHQCGNAATWIRPDYDEWGDIVLCPVHHNEEHPTRHVLSGYFAPVIDGVKAVVPGSYRRMKREWLALRDSRKAAAKT
jgi:hypothetical protein